MATIPDVGGFIIEVRRKNRNGQVGKKGFATGFSGFRTNGKTKVHYTDYGKFDSAHVYGAEDAETIACLVYTTTTRPIRIKVRPVDYDRNLIKKTTPIMTLDREMEIRRKTYPNANFIAARGEA